MYLFSSMFKLWCALSFQTALFEDVVMHLIAEMHIVFRSVARRTMGPISISQGQRGTWFKICTNRDLNLVPEINMCKGGEKNCFLVGIRNGAWSLWNSNATGSYNYLFNSHGKAALLFQQYCLLKNFCEIVSNLLEDLLHQGRACAVIAKRQAEWKQPPVYTQGGLLRCGKWNSSPVAYSESGSTVHLIFTKCHKAASCHVKSSRQPSVASRGLFHRWCQRCKMH